MKKPAYIIKTERLGLRSWCAPDLIPYQHMNRDPEVMRYFPWLLDQEQSRESMQEQIAHERQHGFCFWAADLLETENFIGFIGMSTPRFEASFTPCVEIGWRLMADQWGKGLAPEGAKACLKYAEDVLGIKEIYSFTPLSNLPSERVMQKIGMRKTGTFMHPLVPDAHRLKEHLLYHIAIGA